MKTQEEIKNFFKGKIMFEPEYPALYYYLRAKGYRFTFVVKCSVFEKEINCTFKDFLDWFESKIPIPPDDEIIFVPNTIHISAYTSWNELGFVFNKYQFIYYRKSAKSYVVTPYYAYEHTKSKCKLIASCFNDIEVGGIFFAGKLNRINDPLSYYIKLSNSTYLNAHKTGSILVYNTIIDGSNCYKIVPL